MFEVAVQQRVFACAVADPKSSARVHMDCHIFVIRHVPECLRQVGRANRTERGEAQAMLPQCTGYSMSAASSKLQRKRVDPPRRPATPTQAHPPHAPRRTPPLGAEAHFKPQALANAATDGGRTSSRAASNLVCRVRKRHSALSAKSSGVRSGRLEWRVAAPPTPPLPWPSLRPTRPLPLPSPRPPLSPPPLP